MKSKLFGLGIGIFALATSGFAQLISIGPFVGEHSDGFENSPDYNNGGSYHVLISPDGYMAFTGRPFDANILDIYNEGSAPWGLSANGLAQVHSGNQGLGIQGAIGNPATGSVAFAGSDAREFGGYFACDSNDPHFYLTFFDQNGDFIQQVDIYSTSNTPVWSGFETTGSTLIGLVEFSGNDAPAMDDLQASTTPEPMTYGLLGLGAFALLRRRKSMTPCQ